MVLLIAQPVRRAVECAQGARSLLVNGHFQVLGRRRGLFLCTCVSQPTVLPAQLLFSRR